MKKILFTLTTLAIVLVACLKTELPDPVPQPPDYSKLILNEIDGNNRFVEIYNSSDEDMCLFDVRIQRNDGPSFGPLGSEWVGTFADTIPAGAYRLIEFNSASAIVTNNPANVGWRIQSGLSPAQILKIAIVNPEGKEVDIFMRGEMPLDPWGTTGATSNTTHSYSRMSNGTWAYAVATPGAANGPAVSEIINPGYLTEIAVDPRYVNLRINEASGAELAGGVCDIFYELINIGDAPIDLTGVEIWYNANGSAGQPFPPNDDRLTWKGGTTSNSWMGNDSPIIGPGEVYIIQGRSTCPGGGPLQTGFTSSRKLIITLKDPTGVTIDELARAEDNRPPWVTPSNAVTMSRIPDGTGDFYFTPAPGTPGALNGTNATGLVAVPQTPQP